MKRLLLAVALTAATACGSLPDHGGAPGSVSGTVVAAPCRPVERPGAPPCPPVPGVTVEFGSTSAVTDATGAYSVRLAAGTYPIRVKAGAWERPATPASVTVTPGAAIVLNLAYDSGIR